ncbi:hypothetical protein B296_00019795 [Ensete ventricosum]|uniref:Uncharacterized protein n=1 Tax=Ensete ventricosum TaxID=4639 RepID=A0A427AJV1_ENSVE|nr:hypothetical protein B296_00019795 [Ensete ventricosum]
MPRLQTIWPKLSASSSEVVGSSLGVHRMEIGSSSEIHRKDAGSSMGVMVPPMGDDSTIDGRRWYLRWAIVVPPRWRCAREFARRRSRLIGRLSMVAEKLVGSLTMAGSIKLQPDNEPRSSLRIRPGFGRCGGFCWEFARRFAEGMGSSPGTRREITRKKTRRITTSMPKGIGLAKVRL